MATISRSCTPFPRLPKYIGHPDSQKTCTKGERTRARTELFVCIYDCGMQILPVGTTLTNFRIRCPGPDFDFVVPPAGPKLAIETIFTAKLLLF